MPWPTALSGIASGAGGTALRPDFRWREQLPWPQRRLLEALCAPLLYRYGYLGEVRS